MEMRNIGSLPVSTVGLGCNNFGMTIDAEASRAVVEAALDAGINYFDTADIYGGGKSEEFLGAALAGRRDEVAIASKFGHAKFLPEGQRGGDPAWIRRCIERSLRRLGTARIDHYQIHTPDPDTPVAAADRLTAYATERGRSILELAIGWLASNPTVASVICGATKPSQVAANVAAAGWTMTPAQRAEIAALA